MLTDDLGWNQQFQSKQRSKRTMNTRNKFTITIALVVLACALSANSPTLTTRAARAVSDDVPRRQVNATPPVTLGEGQTFHVTYFNVGSNPFEIIPCVLDADGAHLKMGTAVRLAPGALSSFDISRAEAGRRTEPNVTVRAAVHVDEKNLKSLSVSGEVVEDATGKSTIFVAGLNAPSDPIRPGQSNALDLVRATSFLSPVGITFGQKLRVTFVNVGSNPFEIIPCVLDGDGAHLKTGEALTLLPGETRSFEMSRSEIVERTGSRMQIYGGVHVRNSDLKNLMLTGEVIEESNGHSTLFVPGVRVGFDPQPDPPVAN
jgi:hypothetical protein